MAASDVVVGTGQGPVRGSCAEGIWSFKGLPYAAPPFGTRRFRAPQRPLRWAGVRDASAYGPTAPHHGYPAPFDVLLPDPVIAGEDCLNLNVWTPEPSAAGLPVMVWIHGGAFVNGSGAIPTYDGARFARDGVVLVTINYRLGAEGFLSLPDAVDNRGLLDQLAALEWVQENIAAFGGDPGNVTVFGESAGAMSIGALLATPRSAGLFGRAILQSGAGHHALGTDTAGLVAGELGRRLSLAPTREALAAVDPGTLLDAQADVLLDAQLDPDPQRWGEVAANMMAFEPVVDGELLDDLPIRRIAAGGARGVAILTGTTTDEHRLFLVPAGVAGTTAEETPAAIAGLYGLDAAGAREAYGEGPPGERLADIMGDWFFRVPATRLCEARLAGGETATWQYEFAWPSPASGGALGACHTLEIAFAFDNLDDPSGAALLGEDPPQALADDVHGAWVAFATTGDPGWAPYDAGRRPVMRFGAPSAVVDDPHAARRAVWDGVR